MAGPTKLHLVGKTYDVRHESPAAGDRFGECNVDKCRIILSPDHDEQQRRDTLLHEVLHALWGESGLPAIGSLTDGLEEVIVRTLTPGLLAALRDNPTLVRYLLAK